MLRQLHFFSSESIYSELKNVAKPWLSEKSYATSRVAECFILSLLHSVADLENFGGGDFKHKPSKIRMSSPKLRVIFRPKSEIRTFFPPKIRWSPKKKEKKRSSPKLRVIFRPKSEIRTFFPSKIRWSPKKKKKGLHRNWEIFRN